jgi:hypothetical protein
VNIDALRHAVFETLAYWELVIKWNWLVGFELFTSKFSSSDTT